MIKLIAWAFLGYWLVGMIGVMVFDRAIRQIMFRAVVTMAMVVLWLPIYAMDAVERVSASIKSDLTRED